MSVLTITEAQPMTIAAPTLATDGVIFNKSNAIVSFALDHTLGALGAAVCTIWGYKDGTWYNLEDVNVDTGNDPMVYDTELLCVGWERIYISQNSIAGLTAPQWELVHECHAAGAR